VGSIAASAQDQATGLSQVNQAVMQMDQMTQQNAAMVEETTAAAHRPTMASRPLSRGNLAVSIPSTDAWEEF